jgi:uncharacterized coiled-coil protein SlyX
MGDKDKSTSSELDALRAKLTE